MSTAPARSPASSLSPTTELTVGGLMSAPVGVFPAETPVATAIAQLRELVTSQVITYLYATDAAGRLVGVIVLRDLFFAPPASTLAHIMIAQPFFLTPEMPLLEAMRAVVNRHYPVYPVCEPDGRLVGLIRGQTLFEQQAIVISAQAGRMVGVRAQENLTTSLGRSLRFRSPWLLFNLLLSLLSAAVITYYRDAVRSIVLLAVFLPVIAAQARNTGAQTMAITLRGLTNGEWNDRLLLRVLAKETLLGLTTGTLIAIIAGTLIAVQAMNHGEAAPLQLGLVLAGAMIAGCGLSSALAVLVPLILRRLGADPALASTIIFTAIANVISQSLFLGLAAWWLL